VALRLMDAEFNPCDSQLARMKPRQVFVDPGILG